MFKETYDNWWTATRPDIQSIQEFKAKYWSESTQNMVHNNLSNGRYENQNGQSLTSYFLGKICMARNLEPCIPEECLVIQLSYHYDDAIQKARMYSQVKTIQDMASLLESHEHEWQYQKNRFMSSRNSKINEGTSPPNQQSDNKPPTNNPNNYQGNQCGNNAPRNYNQNGNVNGNFRNDYRGNYQQNGPNNYYRPGNGNNTNRGYRPQVNYVRFQTQRSPGRNYSSIH